jgi:hypothetical protein
MSIMRHRAVALLVAVVVAGGCMSVQRAGPPSSSCTTNPDLVGTWRSYRLSQAGPSWMTIALRCDCTSRSVAQLLFTRYTEEGYYRIEDGTIVFTRPSAETKWPFAFANDRLILTEAPAEQHSYVRVSSEQCSREPAR